jgi:hypothetical protein
MLRTIVKMVGGTTAGSGTAGISPGMVTVGTVVAAGMGAEVGPVLCKERSCMAAEIVFGPAWTDAWSTTPETGATTARIGPPSSRRCQWSAVVLSACPADCALLRTDVVAPSCLHGLAICAPLS